METLPPEIITEILEYLSFDDRRRMALVNRTFRYASLHPALSQQELFVYTAPVQRLRVDDRRRRFEDFKKALREPRRKRLCLKFCGTNRADIGRIFNSGAGWPSSVVSLHLDNQSCLTDSFLDAITNCCDGLEELRLENIGRMCLADKPRRPMLALRSVRLHCVGVSDRCFNVLMSCAPNVADVCIDDCQTYEWLDHANATIDNGISNAGLSDANIVGYLQGTAASTVDSLQLYQCCHVFGAMRSQVLRLKSLLLSQDKPYLSTCRTIDYDKLESALALQVSLQWLEINHLPARLLAAVSGLRGLRHLTLNLNISRDDVGCLREFSESLRDMKRIRTLAVNRVVATSADKERDMLLQTFAIPECAYESLTSLDCSLDSSLCALRAGKRLTSLRIRNGDVLSAGSLRLLFENLVGLRRLWIDNCVCLDDDVMSGLPVSNLRGLVSLKIFNANLTYRCLPHIKLLHLSVLIIDNMSLGPCVALSNLSDFDYCLKTFSCFVPALTQLELQLLAGRIWPAGRRLETPAIEYNTKKCRGRLHSSRQNVVHTTEHNHVADIVKAEAKEVMARLKNIAKTSQLSTHSVLGTLTSQHVESLTQRFFSQKRLKNVGLLSIPHF
ncbi:uncharacterized protein LOC112592404 [Melanaphis sacchari]|uniref:uncharacterized protein LOC112592404 n=1 Tax=Melanaphis sacchari TaxID=742174 RepID=UPI000DC1543A|nr:uncharacterized protein LOC112592404 [Melanaphis sacchari]